MKLVTRFYIGISAFFSVMLVLLTFACIVEGTILLIRGIAKKDNYIIEKGLNAFYQCLKQIPWFLFFIVTFLVTHGDITLKQLVTYFCLGVSVISACFSVILSLLASICIVEGVIWLIMGMIKKDNYAIEKGLNIFYQVVKQIPWILFFTAIFFATHSMYIRVKG